MSKAVGNHCCIVECSCTSAKCRGISFHCFPKAGVSKEQDEWRARLIHAVSRSDNSFKPDKARICSRHFAEDCFKYGPSGTRRTLVPGSLPTLWLPKKSIETPKTSRREPTWREPPPEPERVAYSSFEDLCEDLGKVCLPWCITERSPDSFTLAVVVGSVVRLQVCLQKTDNFKPSVNVFGIPASQLVVDLEHQKLLPFLQQLQDRQLCKGVSEGELQELAKLPDGSGSQQFYRQITNYCSGGKLSSSSCVRSALCILFLETGKDEGNMCKNCCQVYKTLASAQSKRKERSLRPDIKPNNPLHGVTIQEMKEAFKEARRDRNKAEKQLAAFRQKLQKESVTLTEVMHNNLRSVDVSGIDDPLLRLFWEEQEKAFATKNHGMRWHPMMIRLAILLHSKGQGAYETLRKTGVLKLPGVSTLREYTSANQAREGFTAHVKEELQAAADKLDPHQRFVALLHDEMSIKSDLVFDKRSGELVGFVNRDTWSFEEGGEKLATQALVFYVVGLNSNIKMSLGYFGTRTATADELYPLFWEAVDFVEETGLKVVVSTSDKASPNQRLYQMHADGGEEICFKTVNLFAPDRYIYFISDPPHLMKTVRNNLASSGSGKRTKLLWNDGKYLLWRHVADIYRRDVDSVLRRTKLTAEHVRLTSHSVMNVKLAAQVLSHQVGSVMAQYSGPEASETAKFILLMDRFFDCLNSRHLAEANRKRKPDLLPYTQQDDARFGFLEREFLQYLENWRLSVQCRPGDFTGLQRQKMFLTHQTYRGLIMTVRAFIEATKFLLENGVEFVLSNKFCQDPLEEHFGRQRGLGRTHDNPNLQQFGRNENHIRLQRNLALTITPKGNVKSAHSEKVPCTITTSPLKKKQRYNHQ